MTMSKLYLLVLLMCIAAGCASAQDFDCNTGSNSYKRFDPVPICMDLRGLDKSPLQALKKAVFWAKMDEFAMMELDTNFDKADNDTSVDMWVNGLSSGKVAFRKGGVVVPFQTLLVHVTGGEIKKLTWDQPGCSVCEDSNPELCIDNMNCGVDMATRCGAKLNCDVKIYVAFIGTDKKGVPLTSAGKIFSRFRQFSLFNAYQHLWRTAAGYTDDAENAEL
eukprot:GFYU01003385.1.p1 GENE.GFYU01003385.1~~GFYU01003385.1.p1  ORF type:complete len:220 (-),score=28.59 GFYU01003385.1:963-1622(-)